MVVYGDEDVYSVDDDDNMLLLMVMSKSRLMLLMTVGWISSRKES